MKRNVFRTKKTINKAGPIKSDDRIDWKHCIKKKKAEKSLVGMSKV